MADRFSCSFSEEKEPKRLLVLRRRSPNAKLPRQVEVFLLLFLRKTRNFT
jgi:hypothetical protein